MKAVILAAGMGIRLRPMTEKLPKGLIEIDGKALLEHSLNAIKEFGINNVIIVTGHYGRLIEQKLGEDYNGLKLEYIENDSYSKTGSMFSFSKAKKLINEDILLLESDLIYDKKAIKVVLDSKFKNVILVAELRNSGDDVYICANGKNEIINLGKNIPEDDRKKTIGALVGISKYSKEFLPLLFEKAEEDFSNGELNYHYEETVFSTSKLGNPVYAKLCKGLDWIDIDNHNDLRRAKNYIYPQIEGSDNETN